MLLVLKDYSETYSPRIFGRAVVRLFYGVQIHKAPVISMFVNFTLK